ncbi:MAG: aquaporin [Candidatus Saccharimonadales bacterium]
MFGRQKIAALVAEFLGAGVLTLTALKIMYTLSVPFFLALGVGIAMTMAVFVLATRSLGFFNPAITIAMWTARRIDVISAVMFIIVQLLGAWAAYGVFTYFVGNSAPELKSSFSWQAVTVEAIGMGIFAIGLAAATYQAVSRAALASFVGLSLFVGMLLALTAVSNPLTGSASFTGGFLNPAVALGVRGWNIWGSLGWGVSVLGPLLGALVGVNLYKYLLAEPEAVASAGAVATTATPAVAAPKSATTRATAKKPARKTAAKRKTTSRKK